MDAFFETPCTSIIQKRIVFLEIRDLENSTVLTSWCKSKDIFILSTVPIQIDRAAEWLRTTHTDSSAATDRKN